MANGLLDYISGFGATPPEYLGGLLGQEAVDKLKGRAATTGIANAVLGYLAAPKNQNLGLGRIIGQSLQAGMTGAQGVYDTAIQDYQTKAKIDEMNRQKAQREAFDVAAKGLYTTTPAQYATEQVSGGGYLPQTPDANAVVPNFGLSKTYAPATTQQVMTAPASQELSPTALNQMILSGDPRANAYLTGLETIKKLQTPVKADLINIAEGGSVYDPNQGKIVATGTPKLDKISFGAEAERKAAVYGAPYGQLPANIQAKINAEIQAEDINRASAGATKLPPVQKAILEADQKTYEGLTQKANASREIANTTRNINSLLSGQKGGGALKLSANVQKYLGLSNALTTSKDATEALATVAATQIRAAGSGSTSDLEFSAYVNSFPSLATTAAGRQVMADVAEAQAIRNTKLADWTNRALKGDSFSYEGLQEYDRSLGRAISAKIESNYKAALKSAGAGAGGKNIHAKKTDQQIIDELSK
jgi:hypothetical protein